MPILGAACAARTLGSIIFAPRHDMLTFEAVAISICFALLAWRLKTATPRAAASGGVICLCLIFGTQIYRQFIAHSALTPLVALFVLTSLATRFGRKRKVASGLGEDRFGRTTSQIVANLGFAALLAFPLVPIAVVMIWNQGYYSNADWVVAALVLSSLTEATADTVSSEIGQAFGGRPILLTTMQRVEPGTDGAISLLGTLAGILAAGIVAIAGKWSMHLTLEQSAIAIAAGICGLMFDSVLGATLERKGWIGNDLVNFCSTAFPPILCLVALKLFPGIGPHQMVMY
jgi:uncharacterized protein (TIGR00297 family)